MNSNSSFIDIAREKKENRLVFKENLKNSGITVALGKARYLGGHPELLGEKSGTIFVKNVGLFFQDSLNYNYIFIPVDKIVKVEFETGEQTSRNEMLSRVLAFGGFHFAFEKKLRESHIFLTITYEENGVESSILFESKISNRIASAVTKIMHDYAKEKKVETDRTVIELMKEISILRAMSVITEEEFMEKKKDLLSRV